MGKNNEVIVNEVINEVKNVFTDRIVLTKTMDVRIKYDKIEDHPRYEKLLGEFHPTKNGDLKLSDFSYGSGVKLWWKCYDTIHNDHEWESSINRRTCLSEENCPCCSGHKVVLSNCFATTHVELAKQFHPTKNGNLTPYDFTSGSAEKVWWFCTDTDARDHEWDALVKDRTNGHGCSCCSGHKTVLSNCLATLNSELAKTWHPTKNGILTPFDVVLCSNKKVWWMCENKHEWPANISSRSSSGNGCPFCNESRGEKYISNILHKNFIKYEFEKQFPKCKHINNLSFDFYLPNEHILIEYDGIQHFEPRDFFGGEKTFKELILNDSIKTKFAKDNNIPLLRIPYTEFDNIEKLITEFIKNIKLPIPSLILEQ